MLFMCLPFVIYSAGMQMFLDSLSGAAVARVNVLGVERVNDPDAEDER